MKGCGREELPETMGVNWLRVTTWVECAYGIHRSLQLHEQSGGIVEEDARPMARPPHSRCSKGEHPCSGSSLYGAPAGPP